MITLAYVASIVTTISTVVTVAASSEEQDEFQEGATSSNTVTVHWAFFCVMMLALLTVRSNKARTPVESPKLLHVATVTYTPGGIAHK